MRHLGAVTATLAILAALGSAAVGIAQPRTDPVDDAQAEKVAADHFAEGERAFSHRDYARAGEAFEAAYAAKPHEAALWNAARSWERAGELARAANLYRRYLRTAPDGAPDKPGAATALEGLTPKLGRIEIVAPGLSDVEVDGRAVADQVVFVNPGTHLVTGKLPGDPTVVRKGTTLSAGAVESVLLEVPVVPPSASATAAPLASSAPSALPSATAVPSASAKPPPGETPKPVHHGTTPWLLAPFIGTTSVSGIFLIASGIDVLRARSDYEELKKGRSPDEQQQLIQEGVGKTDRTNVLIGVTAGLAIVTGVVALTAIDWGPREKPTPETKPRSSARMTVGPSGASFEARF